MKSTNYGKNLSTVYETKVEVTNISKEDEAKAS